MRIGGPLSETKVSGIPYLAKWPLRRLITASEVELLSLSTSKKLLCWSTVTRYSLLPMRKCRQQLVTRVFLVLLWLWRALQVDDLHMLHRWRRLVHIAVFQQTCLARISGLSLFWGRSLCLGSQREIFVWFMISWRGEWQFSVLLVSVHLVLSTRPCSQITILMNQ